MQYRELGRTGAKVSGLCLGTMTFGEQNTEAEGHAQMDYAVDSGINIFDASEIYPIPPKPETQGRTEAIIGTWLAARNNRDKVMVATKVAGRGKMSWLRKDESRTRQSPAQIIEAVEASLARLKTDYIDLYQLHWPDRPMRVFQGLETCLWKARRFPFMRFSVSWGSSCATARSGSSVCPTRRLGA